MKKCLFPCLRNEEKPALSFFLGIFFLTTLDCLVSYGPRCEKNCFRGWGRGGGGGGVWGGGGGGGVGGFDKECFKPVSSAKETSLKIEISPAASLHMILSKKQNKKALIRLRGCAGWSAPVLFTNPRRQGFSRRGPYYSCIMIRAIVNELHPTFFFCFVFLNSHRKFILLFCWIVLHFICFTKRCLAN